MKHEKQLVLGLSLLLLSFFCFMSYSRNFEEAMAAKIAPEILRFHVLANSDRKEDQELKIGVRDAILQYMQELPSANLSKDAFGNLLSFHLPALEAAAAQYIAASGYDYPITAELVNCHFPPKAYSGLALPEGSYDALQITIGQGKGHNWWCVLYPRLCFTDAVTTKVTEESVQLLKNAAEQGGCLLFEDSRPKIRFLIPDLIAR